MEKTEMQKTRRGQAFSLEVIIGALVTASIMLIVGVYVVVVIGDEFREGQPADVNTTIDAVVGMFATLAPLLVVVGIIAFVAVILLFVRGGISQQGGRGGM